MFAEKSVATPLAPTPTHKMANLGKRFAGALIRLSPNSIRRTIAKQRAQTGPSFIYGYMGNNGEFLPRTRLSNTTSMYKKENIEIEDNVYIGHYTILDGTGSIKIEEGCQIGAYSAVYTHSSHLAIRLLGPNYTLVEEANKPGYIVAPVELGKYVFTGVAQRSYPIIQIKSELASILLLAQIVS